MILAKHVASSLKGVNGATGEPSSAIRRRAYFAVASCEQHHNVELSPASANRAAISRVGHTASRQCDDLVPNLTFGPLGDRAVDGSIL
jgi:hypothetical protein